MSNIFDSARPLSVAVPYPVRGPVGDELEGRDVRANAVAAPALGLRIGSEVHGVGAKGRFYTRLREQAPDAPAVHEIPAAADVYSRGAARLEAGVAEAQRRAELSRELSTLLPFDDVAVPDTGALSG